MDQIAKHEDGVPLFKRLSQQLANDNLSRATARQALATLKGQDDSASDSGGEAGDSEGDEGTGLENPRKSIVCQIKLTAELMDKVTELGGETWLRKMIRKELKAAS